MPFQPSQKNEDCGDGQSCQLTAEAIRELQVLLGAEAQSTEIKAPRPAKHLRHSLGQTSCRQSWK